MKTATWIVNSVKARSSHLIRRLGTFKPDIVMLQEIKCQTEDFPVLDIKALGYEGVALGQKAYSGVALLSPRPITKVITRHAAPPRRLRRRRLGRPIRLQLR